MSLDTFFADSLEPKPTVVATKTSPATLRSMASAATTKAALDSIRKEIDELLGSNELDDETRSALESVKSEIAIKEKEIEASNSAIIQKRLDSANSLSAETQVDGVLSNFEARATRLSDSLSREEEDIADLMKKNVITAKDIQNTHKSDSNEEEIWKELFKNKQDIYRHGHRLSQEHQELTKAYHASEDEGQKKHYFTRLQEHEKKQALHKKREAVVDKHIDKLGKQYEGLVQQCESLVKNPKLEDDEAKKEAQKLLNKRINRHELFRSECAKCNAEISVEKAKLMKKNLESSVYKGNAAVGTPVNNTKPAREIY